MGLFKLSSNSFNSTLLPYSLPTRDGVIASLILLLYDSTVLTMLLVFRVFEMQIILPLSFLNVSWILSSFMLEVF